MWAKSCEILNVARPVDNMKNHNTETMYDLYTITPDRLHFLLSAAKDELKKYNICAEEVEWCEDNIAKEERKKRYYSDVGAYKLTEVALNICIIIFILYFIHLIGFLFQEKDVSFKQLFSKEEILKIPYETYELLMYGILIFSGVLFCHLVGKWYRRKIAKKKIKVVENKIAKYEAELADLQEKAKKAKNEFKAILFIPNDYCHEYALTKMLKFIENKQAKNWERVTDLYEEHVHRMQMEDDSRQSLEQLKQSLKQSKLQTEYARQTSNRAGWAAAGAWAAAAGIWRR